MSVKSSVPALPLTAFGASLMTKTVTYKNIQCTNDATTEDRLPAPAVRPRSSCIRLRCTTVHSTSSHLITSVGLYLLRMHDLYPGRDASSVNCVVARWQLLSYNHRRHCNVCVRLCTCTDDGRMIPLERPDCQYQEIMVSVDSPNLCRLQC